MNELQKVEYNGIIVLTTQQIAEAYGTDAKVLSKNFERNKDRFIERKHYIKLSGDELKEFKANRQNDENLKFAPVLYLWTQKGAFLHAKSLNTDKAWEVYDILVDNYFEKKKEEINVNQLSPELQMFNQIFQQVAKTELEQKKLAERADQQEKNMKTIIDTFKGTDSDVGTEKWVNRCISKIAESDDFSYSFGNKYAAARNESYRRLSDRASCRLDQKLRNAISRAEERGCTKELINQISKLSVIMQDKRLKEIYIGVIKEMMIAYRVEIA
jgi:hypothetical protein